MLLRVDHLHKPGYHHGMELSTQHAPRTLDVTGLPEEAIQSLASLVALLRGRTAYRGGTISFSSREEWIKAIGAWAASHQPSPTAADWSRESIYAGRGE